MWCVWTSSYCVCIFDHLNSVKWVLGTSKAFKVWFSSCANNFIFPWEGWHLWGIVQRRYYCVYILAWISHTDSWLMSWIVSGPPHLLRVSCQIPSGCFSALQAVKVFTQHDSSPRITNMRKSPCSDHTRSRHGGGHFGGAAQIPKISLGKGQNGVGSNLSIFLLKDPRHLFSILLCINLSRPIMMVLTIQTWSQICLYLSILVS